MDECITKYLELSKSVFREDNILLKIPSGESHSRFDEKPLETALKSVIKDKLDDENASMAELDDQTSSFCPVFVVATDAQNADGPPRLFRSYGFYRDECPIWQAARATSAAPTYFKPAFVEVPEPGGWYVDGGLRRNNPSAVALEEARNYWETVEHFCIVSIGTGRQRTVTFSKSSRAQSRIESDVLSLREKIAGAATAIISKIPGGRRVQQVSRVLPSVMTLKAIVEEVVKLSTSAEDTHEEMLKLANSDQRVSYHRFNVQRGLDQIGLEEWAKATELAALTRGYLEGTETQLALVKCAKEITRSYVEGMYPGSPN